MKAQRYRIFTAPGRDFLCVVSAASREAAMKTAKSIFQLTRAAFALEETPYEAATTAKRVSITK
jgi:hypothetical protein